MNGSLTNIRNRLEGAKFKRSHTGDWELTLPTFYASLFERQNKALCERCRWIGWRDSKQDASFKYTYLKSVSEKDQEAVEAFIRDFSSYMLIGKSTLINKYFGNELDACIALDRNFATPFNRTEIGQLEYEAKYQESEPARNKLIHLLHQAIGCANRFRTSKSAVIGYIPFSKSKEFDLPAYLSRQVSERLPPAFYGDVHREPIHMLHSHLTHHKLGMKNASVEQKVEFWKDVVHNSKIVISQPVADKTVFVFDDMYQSGITMWAYAEFLKKVGAREVIGVVCVKAGKDTDNTDST